MNGAAQPGGSAGADPQYLQHLQTELVALREQKKRVEKEVAEKEGRPAHLPFRHQASFAAVQPSPYAGDASKRQGVFSPQGGDVKRQRTGEGADRAREEIWRNCNKLLGKMLAKTEAIAFKQPVDAVAMGIFDYHKIITRPMDLGTIKTKLGHHAYSTPHDFCADVRLVFQNCRTYNAPTHQVCKLGDLMSDFFEKHWAAAHMEQQWEATMEYVSIPQLIERALPGYQEAVRRAMAGPPRPPDREMTSDEKRRLSVDLTELPADRMYDILRLIVDQMPQLYTPNDEEEVEVDLDQLTPEAAWRVRELVDFQRAPPGRAGARPSGVKAGGGGALQQQQSYLHTPGALGGGGLLANGNGHGSHLARSANGGDPFAGLAAGPSGLADGSEVADYESHHQEPRRDLPGTSTAHNPAGLLPGPAASLAPQGSGLAGPGGTGTVNPPLPAPASTLAPAAAGAPSAATAQTPVPAAASAAEGSAAGRLEPGGGPDPSLKPQSNPAAAAALAPASAAAVAPPAAAAPAAAAGPPTTAPSGVAPPPIASATAASGAAEPTVTAAPPPAAPAGQAAAPAPAAAAQAPAGGGGAAPAPVLQPPGALPAVGAGSPAVVVAAPAAGGTAAGGTQADSAPAADEAVSPMKADGAAVDPSETVSETTGD